MILPFKMCHLNQACPKSFVCGPNKGFFSYLRAARPWTYHGNMMTIIYLGMALTCIIINYKRASLACAPRLADTACPQIRPAGVWSYSI